MKIMDFLVSKAVSANLTSTNKKEVIEGLLGLLINAGAVEKKLGAVHVAQTDEGAAGDERSGKVGNGVGRAALVAVKYFLRAGGGFFQAGGH